MLITVVEFCNIHKIEISFVRSLQQSGLIKLTTIEESTYFKADQLLLAEKYIRFYYDFNINIEGIETITHLLQQIATLQNETMLLRNRLQLYETNHIEK